MNPHRVGSSLRAVRTSRRWTLRHAAATGEVSAAVASRIENGRLDLVSLGAVEAYARGLGTALDLVVRWQGGDLERLLNRRHSAMHERMAVLWRGLPNWEATPEVSFSIYGERGIIDWLAWHGATRTALITELKSQLVDVQELVGTNDRRVRLARTIARERGWDAAVVASWIVLEDSRTNRRHLAQHQTFLRAAFPSDGRAIGRWLRDPTGPIHCLSFLRMTTD